MWREFFYTMSAQNPYFGEMERNPICLSLPWRNNDEILIQKWENGQTGYPFIDAVMRQLKQVGGMIVTYLLLCNCSLSFLTNFFLLSGGVDTSCSSKCSCMLSYKGRLVVKLGSWTKIFSSSAIGC